MAKCFIAMPITTPDVYAKQLNDVDHFIHVLDYLFKPALAMGDYEVILPKSIGSELIHAAIIENLEECELVLCDISALNPNVFFELGIRTALDKPVAIVRDSLTPTLPFDTSSINVHMYDVDLRPWSLDSEIAKLAEHISTTEVKSEDRNSLWRFFAARGANWKREEDTRRRAEEREDRRFELEIKLQALNKRVEIMRTAIERGLADDRTFDDVERLLDGLMNELQEPAKRILESAGEGTVETVTPDES